MCRTPLSALQNGKCKVMSKSKVKNRYVFAEQEKALVNINSCLILWGDINKLKEKTFKAK